MYMSVRSIDMVSQNIKKTSHNWHELLEKFYKQKIVVIKTVEGKLSRISNSHSWKKSERSVKTYLIALQTDLQI